jgi:hypothetical protein
VVFTRTRQIVLASTRTLRSAATIRLAGVRAFGLEPGGTNLLVGRSTGLMRIDLGSCKGA